MEAVIGRLVSPGTWAGCPGHGETYASETLEWQLRDDGRQNRGRLSPRATTRQEKPVDRRARRGVGPAGVLCVTLDATTAQTARPVGRAIRPEGTGSVVDSWTMLAFAAPGRIGG